MPNLCLYTSSSNSVPEIYRQAAEHLGELMARNGYTLVYGGGTIGLMGVTARSLHRHGGQVIGVIPEYLSTKEVAYEQADEFIVTPDLRTRKAIMEDRADAFVSLPGGFGTLEETLEILTLKQLRQHSKPIVLVNTNGFFNPLLELFEHLYQESFTSQTYRSYYHVVDSPDQIFPYLQSYSPPIPQKKWVEI